MFRYCFKTIYRHVDRRFDLRGSDLSEMITYCLSHSGKLSLSLRERYLVRTPVETVAYIERCTAHMLFGPAGLLGKPQNCRQLLSVPAKPCDRNGSTPAGYT